MNHFFSPWMLLALLIPPVLLAWRFVKKAEGGRRKAEESRGEGGGETEEVPDATGSLGTEVPSPQSATPAAAPSSFILHPSSLALPGALVALSVALFTAAVYWNPVGARRDGRVMVVERHSQWEPTTKPYDTTWYAKPPLFGEASGYNYAAIYKYLGQYYEMSRLLETDKIDDDSLGRCDVLVIKVPTKRYSKEEVEAVVRFVEQGGGLLLIGDHTNYERSSTIMNDIARPMGFIFRDDLLFSFNQSPYDQQYVPPQPPHPIVQHVPPLDFAVSCSVDPGWSRGRAAVANTGLWSMGPAYHHDNYHPFPQHCPEMRYGAFVQVWAARHGQGRAVAFTDSTIFSNFCTFQPGKAELMLEMLEWLNHGNPPVNPRLWLGVLGFLALAAGAWIGRPLFSVHHHETPPHCNGGALDGASDVRNTALLLLLAVGGFGWVAGSVCVAAAHRWSMPEPECVRPLTRVVIDRTTSAVPLARGLYPQGNDAGYGMLEAWIPRLGCYTVRKEGPDAFSGDVLVVICPSRSVTAEFRRQVTEYVAEGGKLLVIDSPENAGSTANSLLWPFGLSIHRDRAWQGKLNTTDRLPALEIASANEVTGGQAVGRVDKLAVVATAKHGKGSVMAIGCGSLWNDTRMGENWMLEPDATVKARYDVWFALLRSLLEDKPLPGTAPPVRKPKAELPMKESGPAEL